MVYTGNKKKNEKWGVGVGEKKYPVKSATYKGVYQRKNGSWFYRAKRIVDGKAIFFQDGNYITDKVAYDARKMKLALETDITNKWKGQTTQIVEIQGETFGEYFQNFLDACDSASSAKKYGSLYQAQLKMWENRPVHSISDADIDILMLRLKLSTKKYTDGYISSIRKVLKKFYQYVRHVEGSCLCTTAQFISTKPYKLRVLSLFSGIGAPERALEELKRDHGIDYEIVNFCEFDDKASNAYCLLHNESPDKGLIDVEEIDKFFCKEQLPDFDLMIFGFPCQDLSSQGNQEGLVKDGGTLPEYSEALSGGDALSGLTRSGLLYNALHIALWKRPKFMIAENVDTFLGRKYRNAFNSMLRIIQVDDNGLGYNIYFDRLNSKNYGVPQNRNRAFMVMIRRDLNISYHFPDAVELKAKASDWFDTDVSDEFYIPPTKVEKLNREGFKPNFKTDVISCITTKWGTADPYVQQTLVKDKKGIRCLTSEELMKFQGFEPGDAVTLRDNGFTPKEIGKLVGNSITVPVIKEVIHQLIKCFGQEIDKDIIPYQIMQAPIEGEYLAPLFAYTGNKYRLLPYLQYVMPSLLTSVPMFSSIFVDLFAGSATIALNIGDRADTIIINDVDAILIGIYKALSQIEPETAWKMVMEIVNRYQLSAKNQEGYIQCRTDYNKIPIENRDEYWYWALAIIYHSYNTSTISYNKKGGVNSSFGRKKCNIERMKRKFFPFAEKLYKGNYTFTNCSFQDFAITEKCMDEEVFYYVDPPYYASEATYNKNWNEQNERELYQFLDACASRGERWVLSNALENNGQRNEILATWLRENQSRYRVLFMNRDYEHCSYNRKNKGRTIEVLVMNFAER